MVGRLRMEERVGFGGHLGPVGCQTLSEIALIFMIGGYMERFWDVGRQDAFEELVGRRIGEPSDKTQTNQLSLF